MGLARLFCLFFIRLPVIIVSTLSKICVVKKKKKQDFEWMDSKYILKYQLKNLIWVMKFKKDLKQYFCFLSNFIQRRPFETARVSNFIKSFIIYFVKAYWSLQIRNWEKMYYCWVSQKICSLWWLRKLLSI